MPAEKQTSRIGSWITPSNGHLTTDKNGDEKTDYSRWRLTDVDSRHTWVYLEDDEENRKWPQSIAEKYHLGLPTVYFTLSLFSSPHGFLQTNIFLRAFLIFNAPRLQFRPLKMDSHFFPSFNCLRATGLVSMVALCSFCQEL